MRYYIRNFIYLLILTPLFANAETNITSIKIRPSLQLNYPTTAYFSLENNSNEPDYLLEVKLVSYPNSKVTLNKTVIENNIAHIIKIDRLSIPALMKLSSEEIKVYLVIESAPIKLNKIEFEFIFASGKKIFG